MIGQILLNGVVAGAMYILAGLSFGIIFTTTGIFHFAHGAVFTMGGFFFYQLAVVWQVPFLIALTGSIVFASLLGVLIERVCYKPLEDLGATQVQIFLTAVGVTIILQNLALLVWKSEPVVVPISGGLLQGRSLGGLWITLYQVILLASVLCIWGLVHMVMFKTRLGKAIRAFAADPETAELMGLDTLRLRLMVFLLGSAIISLAAALQIMDLGMDTTTGLGIALTGVIAALIGTAWGLNGIAVAGLALGIIENIGTVIFSMQWKYVILFGVIIVLLIIRPKVLFKQPS
ncbi:MAG: branched-chain amino acid ABC transporter permease [Deltaproteobacteria bacterium]|nr:branched-chain amino acid ABC transporter permease [Deltaproteobacteria bacterium]